MRAILEALEEGDLQYVRELSLDIGVYRKIMEIDGAPSGLKFRCQRMILNCETEINEIMEGFYDRRGLCEGDK